VRTTIPTHTTKSHNLQFLPSCFCVYAVPKIPLIEDLTTGPIQPGSSILVEYDASSQWYNASLTIAAEWLRTGGPLAYYVSTQPPDKVRLRLKQLGLNTDVLERDDLLRIIDWYTVTLGRKSQEKFARDSLKVADLSIWFSQFLKGPPAGAWLNIVDNFSTIARFNDEKTWVEFALTRAIPAVLPGGEIGIMGIIRGVHSDWACKQLEAALDGTVDFRLEEAGDETRNLIRVRNMRNVGFDSRWHHLKVSDKFEVAVEK
jgi:KaiC/GvpD/RAD55 family RecA-like ATPase